MKKTIRSFFFNALLLTTLSATDYAGVIYPPTEWGKIPISTSSKTPGIPGTVTELSIGKIGGKIVLFSRDKELLRTDALHLTTQDNPVFLTFSKNGTAYEMLETKVNVRQDLHIDASFNLCAALHALKESGLIRGKDCFSILSRPFYDRITELSVQRSTTMSSLRHKRDTEGLSTADTEYFNWLPHHIAHQIQILQAQIEAIETDFGNWLK